MGERKKIALRLDLMKMAEVRLLITMIVYSVEVKYHFISDETIERCAFWIICAILHWL